MRYTECRLRGIAEAMLLADINMDAVDFTQTFDDSQAGMLLNSVSGLWYRRCGIESRSTNQNCLFRKSHRPARRQSDRVTIL